MLKIASQKTAQARTTMTRLARIEKREGRTERGIVFGSPSSWCMRL